MSLRITVHAEALEAFRTFLATGSILKSYSQTSSFRICKARKTRSRRNSFSFCGVSSGFPVGLTIPPEAMARERAHFFRHRYHGANLHYRYLQSFDFLTDRCAAASARASGRGE